MRQTEFGRGCRHGFTLVELLVCLACLGILVGMMLPAMRQVREPARRSTCMNNIRQIALACHNYESAHQHFPVAIGDLFNGGLDQEGLQGSDQLSGLVQILPFIEYNDKYDQIAAPSTYDGINYPAGPPPWKSEYPHWQFQIPGFICPSNPETETGFGQAHYAFSIGDQARGIHVAAKPRGAFGCKVGVTFDDLTDGCSNIIAMAEMGVSDGLDVVSNFAINQPEALLDHPANVLKLKTKETKFGKHTKLGVPGRGGRWADGRAGCAMVNTILPPNSPSAAVGGAHGSDGFYSAGGYHPGCVVVAMMDGSGHTINFDVKTDLTKPTLSVEEMADDAESPHGLWGALGAARDGAIAAVYDI